jgi:lipoprotein-anchoring transpeptidase ErfK/SrfK
MSIFTTLGSTKSKILIIILLLFTAMVFPTNSLAMQKRIEVNLTKQRLSAFEDQKKIYDFPVSTGKIATPTPTGGFWPWIKLRYTRMEGGSKIKGDYYNLPNVPYVVYFYNAAYPKYLGYALHGTYWHNNFGHPMSHGCVNLRTSDMALLYKWIDLVSFNNKGEGSGTIISIYGKTPLY